MNEDNLDEPFFPEVNATLLKKDTEGLKMMFFSHYVLNKPNDEYLRCPKNQIQL